MIRILIKPLGIEKGNIMKPTLYNAPKIAGNIYRNFFQLTLSFLCLAIAATAQTIQTATDGMTPSGLKAGTPAGSYSLSGFENVNPYNGNLNFTMPLLKVGGRGGAQYTITLSLNSIHWRAEKDKAPCEHEATAPRSNWQVEMSNYCANAGPFYYSNPNNWQDDVKAGYSPGVLVGRHTGKGGTLMSPYFTNTLTRLTFITADGTEYELRDIDTNGQIKTGSSPGYNRGKVFVTRDGTAATFISNEDIRDERNQGFAGAPFYPSGVLLHADGTRYEIVNGRVKIMRDANGNYIRFVYEAEPVNNIVDGRVIQIVDSLNRTVDISYATAGDTITYKGFGGATRSIQILRDNLADALRPNSNYQIRTYQDLFTPSQGFNNSNSLYDPEDMAKEIILPDNRSYKLYYNEYGEFSRFETPTGAAIEYDYTSPSDSVISSINGPQVHRRVTVRRLYPNGGTGNTFESKQTYAAVYSGDGTSSNPWKTVATVEQRDASNNLLSKDKHYYDGSPTASLIVSAFRLSLYGGWNEGKETKTEVYDTNGSTILRTSESFYQQRENISWWSGYAGSNLTAADEPANDPRLIRTESTLNDSGQKTKVETAFDDFNNPTEVKEYDYGTGGNFGSMLRRTVTSYVTSSAPINGIDYTCATAQTCGTNPVVHLRRLVKQRSVYDANGSEKARTVFEYDNYSSDSRHATLIQRSNVTGSCFVFNSQNNAWSCTTASFASHYPRGNLTGIISYPNISNLTEYVTTSAQYDVLGNIVKTVDARGYSTTLSYNDCFGSPDGNVRNSTQCNNSTISQLNGLQTFALVTSASNPLGHTTYAQYDYNLGMAVDGEDINGVVSSGYYNDPLDRPTQIIRAANISSLKNQTSFIYDDANKKVITKSDLNTFNDNLLIGEGRYDNLGRTTEVRKYEKSGYVATRTEYDSLGRAYKVSNPFRPESGEQPFWTTTQFDSLGRAIEIKTLVDNAKVLTAYSGTKVLVTDQAGKQRISDTNALGQLTDVWEIRSSDADTVSVTFPNHSEVTQGYKTSYQYDTLGNLLTVNQGVQTRNFTYDSLSRLLNVTNPENGTTAYTYNPAGNILTRTDARNVRTNYSYDEVNRVLTRSYELCAQGQSCQPEGTPTVTYSYDDSNIALSKGMLTKVSSSVSETLYTGFDALGRITSNQQITDGQAYTMSYTYNFANALISQTYPSGRMVTTSYDTDGNLANVSSKSNSTATPGTYASAFRYTPAGAIQSMKLGNGRFESTLFNSRLQPIEIGLGTSVNNKNLLKLNYAYGIRVNGVLDSTKNNGNIESQSITVPDMSNPFVQTYEYDQLNRLSTATETQSGQSQPNWKQTFSYDRYGNRNFVENQTSEPFVNSTNRNLFNPQIDTSNNRFSVNQGYEYDAAGNITKDASDKRYAYDAENKQVSFGTGGSNTNGGSYFYDGDGQRVKKIVGNETIIFIYDASGLLVAEYSTTPVENPKISYLTTDTLGSPRINTDEKGQVVARHDYMPFGEEIKSVGNRSSGNGYQNDNVKQKFTGYERDSESELDFAQARYYSSQHGRFTTIDPLMESARIGSPKTLNRYTYALNNPLRFTDPTGLDATECEQTGDCSNATSEEQDQSILKKDFDIKGITYTPIMGQVAPSYFFLAKVGMPDCGISYEEVEIGRKDIVPTNNEVNNVLNKYASAIYTNEGIAGAAYDAINEANGSITVNEINLVVGVKFGEKVEGSAQASTTFKITNTSDIDSARRTADGKLTVEAINTLRAIKTVATGSPDTPRNLTDNEITQILTSTRQTAVSQANVDLDMARKVRQNSERGIRKP